MQGFPSWESVTFHRFPLVQAERDKEKDVSLKTLKLIIFWLLTVELNVLNAY